MHNKILKLILLGLFLNTGISNAIAATKSSSPNGFFFGAETGIFTSDSHMTYNMRTSSSPQTYEVFNKSTSIKENPAFLVFGARYYMPSSKEYLQQLGFGIKGWFGFGTHSNSFSFTSASGAKTDVFDVYADSKRYGIEGQIYYDIARFKWLSKASSVGVQLGVGYEYNNFSGINYRITNVGLFSYRNSEGYNYYDDESIVYSVGLFLTVGSHRIDFGYKDFNYSNKEMQSSIYTNQFNKVSIIPQNAFYVTYSVKI